MIGIRQTGIYIPDNCISNLTRLDKFKTDEDFILNKIGIRKVTVKNKDEDVSDLCVKAFADLEKKERLDRASIKALILITQNPESNIPHTSALIHDKLDLQSNCACFDISLGCSGYVYGLSVLKA
ncbi:MAG: ketoacyl-ACP synthase III, partial [Ignavibacteriae bacterium]|nr:ketoacyl-ACP synthase III [Ignavibacteriota bacterium]